MSQIDILMRYLTTLIIYITIIVIIGFAFFYLLNKYQNLKRRAREEKEQLEKELREEKERHQKELWEVKEKLQKEVQGEKDKNLNNKIDEIKDIVKNGRPTEGTKSLCDRELEILGHILNGEDTDQIANLLNISRNTVKTHRKNIYSKTGAHNVLELFKVTANLFLQENK